MVPGEKLQEEIKMGVVFTLERGFEWKNSEGRRIKNQSRHLKNWFRVLKAAN